MPIELTRPLVYFDLETTGIDVASDKIVEISALRVEPDGAREQRTRRVNPGRPIPAGATAVHGIRDEDVRDEPLFAQVARGFLEFLDGADLAGFNVARFDVPLLERELRECGMDLRLTERKVIDAMTIYHRKERRDLSAAARFYLNREHEGAHAADADVTITAEILEAQLARYDDLPKAPDALEAWCRRARPGSVDERGKFVWKSGEVVLSFGKHRGKPLRAVVAEDSGYLEWILQSDFPADAKKVASDALRGQYPEPASSPAPGAQST